MYDTYIGHGAVGGYMDTFEALGKETARIALATLGAQQTGAKANPASVETRSYIADWRQLKKWGLSESLLPPNAVLRYKAPSLWERYRWAVVATGGVLAAQFATIAGLLLQRRSRHRAEGSLRDSEQRMNLATISANLGIWGWDLKSDHVRTNESCQRMFGLPSTEVSFSSFLDCLHPDDQHQVRRHIRDVVADRALFETEYRAVHRDGEVRWIALTGRAESDALGNVTHITGVARDVTERKQADESLRQLTGQLLQLQDAERRRLARELHDVTAQNLLAVLFNLARLDRRASAKDKEERDILADSQALCQQALQEIRTLSYLLHPPLLDEAGLPAALHWYVNGFMERSAIRVDLLISPNAPEQRLSLEMETVMFRVVQECLTNIHRYSEAKNAVVRLIFDEESVTLEVRDNGTGIPPAKLNAITGEVKTVGVGIAGMRERLRQLGGKLSLRSNSEGTEVVATFPRTPPTP